MATKIAYVMSRFPKVSETFILYEILELKKLGLDIDIFPILRERESVQHAEVESLLNRVHYTKLFSWSVISAQFYWFFRNPLVYLALWFTVIIGHLSSPKMLSRALAVIPLGAYFAKKARELGIEHIHAHWATHPALMAYVIKSLTGISYSFTSHAHDIYVHQTFLAEKLRNANWTVTISDYNRCFLTDLCGTEAMKNTSVLHCGVDSSVFKPAPTQPDNEVFTMVTIASLEEKKGHYYLIEALAQLKSKGFKFKSLLIGEGETRPEVEAQIAKHGLDDSVKLLGRQPRDQVQALLDKADALILPSIITAKGKMEGIPVALMEALAMELPVIATRISGIPELIEDKVTGMLVPEKDAGAIAEAIQHLMEHPEERIQLGKTGRERVIAEFDMQTNAERLYEMIKSS